MHTASFGVTQHKHRRLRRSAMPPPSGIEESLGLAISSLNLLVLEARQLEVWESRSSLAPCYRGSYGRLVAFFDSCHQLWAGYGTFKGRHVFVIDCSNTLTIPKFIEPQKQLQSHNQDLQRKRYTNGIWNSKTKERRLSRKKPQRYKSDLRDQRLMPIPGEHLSYVWDVHHTPRLLARHKRGCAALILPPPKRISLNGSTRWEWETLKTFR